jgi:hypothetical protein
MSDIVQLAIPVFILLVILEAAAGAVMRRDLYDAGDTAASFSMGIGNLLVNLFSKAVEFSVPTSLYRFAIFHIGYQWWSWLLVFFADDFTYKSWVLCFPSMRTLRISQRSQMLTTKVRSTGPPISPIPISGPPHDF